MKISDGFKAQESVFQKILQIILKLYNIWEDWHKPGSKETIDPCGHIGEPWEGWEKVLVGSEGSLLISVSW